MYLDLSVLQVQSKSTIIRYLKRQAVTPELRRAALWEWANYHSEFITKVDLANVSTGVGPDDDTRLNTSNAAKR